MANRTFEQSQYSLIKRLVYLYPVISVPGGTGALVLQKRTFSAMGATSVAPSSSLGTAPTTGVGYAVGDGRGVRSVTRTGAGLWTLTLSDSYQFLVSCGFVQYANATGLSSTNGIPTVGINTVSTNVTTNTGVGNGGVISLVLNGTSGTAVDITSAGNVTLEIVLGDATEP